jgi:hypothetical protein
MGPYRLMSNAHSVDFFHIQHHAKNGVKSLYYF